MELLLDFLLNPLTAMMQCTAGMVVLVRGLGDSVQIFSLLGNNVDRVSYTWVATTGEAHFCAPAFSYVLRTKTGTFFVTLFSPISIALRPSRPASRPASKLAPKCFVLIPMVSRR